MSGDGPSSVYVRDGSIKLGQFLKLANLIESGGEAKHALSGGIVRVNGDIVVVTHASIVPSPQEIATLTAWISTPTRPPTTVPLMRMNCRSRPTCSSMRRAASRPSHRSTVWVITAVSSAP